jgi:hypothetical protein
MAKRAYPLDAPLFDTKIRDFTSIFCLFETGVWKMFDGYMAELEQIRQNLR